MNSPSPERAPLPRAEIVAVSAKSAATLGGNLVRNLRQWGQAVTREPRLQNPPLPEAAIPAVVLILAATVASMFFIDIPALDWARHLPPGVTAAFEEITNFGLSGWFLVPFGVIVLGLAAVLSPTLPRATQGVVGALAARFGYLFLAIAVPGLFVTIVKRLIGRARPYLDIHSDPFTYKPFIWRPEYASMPSGHATTAASAALAIGALWPRSRPFMWLYALLIMMSRVVVTAHHPSDAIAGALVGIIGAALVRRWFAARGLVFSARDLRVYPGPSFKRIKAAVQRLIESR